VVLAGGLVRADPLRKYGRLARRPWFRVACGGVGGDGRSILEPERSRRRLGSSGLSTRQTMGIAGRMRSASGAADSRARSAARAARLRAALIP
jgi:hypothetical protein